MVKERNLVRDAKDIKEFWQVDGVINDKVAAAMYNALMVIALDPKIKSYLAVNDQKALNQVNNAISDYVQCYQESTADNL